MKMNRKAEPGAKGESDTTDLPSLIFGTSGLGNLYVALPYEEKLEIVKQCFLHSKEKVVFDTAGKYGAGLALETLGQCLEDLNISPDDVIISNKLGWLRQPLTAAESTFEPGVWKNLKHDAIQEIGYDAMMRSFEQGNKLMNGYKSQMVSVHDPDEYLNTAGKDSFKGKLYDDILDGYEALFDLKKGGDVRSVGVGAKDWSVIKRITKDISLDWVMIANSMTIKSHPLELMELISELDKTGTTVINSAVFNSGFLVGGNHFNYKAVNAASDPALFKWREKFFACCKFFSVTPAEACVQFALNVPGVTSIALSTSNPENIKANVEMTEKTITPEFWSYLKENQIIEEYYHADYDL